MCGFAGYVDGDRATDKVALEAVVQKMSEVVRHRGPDDNGVWADAKAGVALGHRRLSIQDLTTAGHQPMSSPTGRYVMVYNGEIYNCQELRRAVLHENPNIFFRGHSDTEVMLAGFEQWGIEPFLKRVNGMFAFALWDQWERTLFLGRDRIGEKPLYYGWVGQKYFLFGSELKALRAHWAFDAVIDRAALGDYARFNSIPGPQSIYQGIYKLPPASLLRYSEGALSVKSYWSMRECVLQGISKPFGGSEVEAVDELDSLLRDAVKLRMYADVPIGAFLSGGIDSSLLVALMQAQTTIPVRTFSIGFHDPAYDEAREARVIARHLGTEHTEMCVTSEQAMSVISNLPEIYDEPFADSSQIPTLLVSQLTRRYVAVSLSGDGGDEVFGGYNRYTWGGKLWKRISYAPLSMRRLLGAAITTVGTQTWDNAFHHARSALPATWRQRLPGYKMHKLADLLSSTDQQNMYDRMASHWLNPESVVLGARTRQPMHMVDGQKLDLCSPEQQAMYLDTITYLPNDILVKLDRATMAVGLEGRAPYLDHRVLEFAWRLPQSMKIRPNQGKWILRQILQRYVPRQLTERQKMGFGIPLDSWLRGPLREWAEELLDQRRLREEGFFKPEAIRQKWADHLSGRGAWQNHLWGILMFQLWLEQTGKKAGVENRSYQPCHR